LSTSTDPEKDGHESREDSDHRVVTKRVDRQNGEMSEHARCDRVTTSSWRTHSRQELSVQQKDLARVFQVVPVTYIKPHSACTGIVFSQFLAAVLRHKANDGVNLVNAI